MNGARESSRVLGRMCLVLLAAALAGTGQRCLAKDPLSGRVRIDGSSTVAPIMMAAAEMFQAEHPKARVTVGISGTGGGFKKFLEARADLRTDISNASRPITPTELSRAEQLGVQFFEIPIGIDGIAVLVNPGNDFVTSLTVGELRRIWEPGSQISHWNQVRPEFPDVPLRLYGPGTDSGTFDYFTEVIMGKARACRSDFTASESDNVLVQGVSGDAAALGYFGYSYYEANKTRLKLVAIDPGNGSPVRPSLDLIRAGRYTPLSRPMFLYINAESYAQPAVQAFLQFLLDNAPSIVEHPRVNFVALPPALYDVARQRLAQGVHGSAMAGADDADLMEVFGGRGGS